MGTNDASTADAPRDDELAELIKAADEDEGAGASEMSDRLRDRTEQSAAEPEQAGDLED
ncbi:hypothetical protein [Herbiconiux flava]|uniref:Uncharacterized protein n=1 Tax=Herbiconiux flava TaxID=881268 RepID=A0A852STR5_9MICO|nr:hypothetical protein [Herbiconiux flava]NYD72115.1 hypothetical protein [Herbiconiux flava]GLK17921.1 hypothetical protein GCM10017602_24030 [Herbiconiux flava]